MPQTPFEKSLTGIIDVFEEYSAESEPRNRLSKAEFAKMLRKELPNFNRELDLSIDMQLSFDEFVALLGKILAKCPQMFHHDH